MSLRNRRKEREAIRRAEKRRQEPVEVQIVWYSKDKLDVYHFCLNCYHNADIQRDNLVFGDEEEVQLVPKRDDPSSGLSLCQDCMALFRADECRDATITVQP